MAYSPTFWPARLTDQDFGLCITPHDFISSCLNYNTYGQYNYYRPWKWSVNSKNNIINDLRSTIENDKEKLNIMLDVRQFKPHEINVKVRGDEVIVEGSHEERLDEHGFISRKFTRRYALPRDCPSEEVVSTLSTDGILTVTAKKKPLKNDNNENTVPIQYCGTCPVKAIKQSSSLSQGGASTSDIKISDENTKKKSQLMLREDHCCLLKPEFLEKTVKGSAEIAENKIESKELKTTSEKTEEASAALSEIREMLDKSKKLKSQLTEGLKEQTSLAMAETTEKFGQSSTSTASEMSSFKSTSCETTEDVLYKSSMSSSVKISSETSEYIGDIISAELREAAEN